MLAKVLLFAAFCAVAATFGDGVSSMQLYGKEVCSKGQIYWCNNLRNAKRCNAVKHCIQSVWERQTLPEDKSEICNVCKDMVAQARAQLESNETQEELKEVFEGSCKLIPVKVVSEECIKLADEFIPELVETLASQMNPQMVCSVAGLCNSERNDKLLAEYKASLSKTNEQNNCDGCRLVVSTLKDRFHGMSRDGLMEELLEVCGRTGSLSDGCSSLVVTHLNTIYSHLTKNFQPQAVCDLAGICHAQYHYHKKPEDQVTKEPSFREVSVGKIGSDDLPCELCEQLVIHLRDVLVANTTEEEFREVMKGLCQQMGSFKSECLSLVDSYWSQLYDFLTHELNPNAACEAIHICKTTKSPRLSIAPLLPREQILPSSEELAYKSSRTTERMTGGWKEEGLEEKPLPRVHLEKDSPKVLVIAESSQLPIERTMPQTIMSVGNKEVCAMCEYFLHYLQQALTSPASEAKIKEVVDHACENLPSSISETCVDFVNTYGDALVALLAQEIDPSQLCPSLGICPGNQLLGKSEIFDKPTCPLCLMAIEQLDKVLKDNKTEENIKKALESVCSQMPKRLVAECDVLVDTYSEQLVDMLIADFTPQEVCVYLKLCTGRSLKMHMTNPKADFEIVSNEIPLDEVTHMELDKPVLSHVAKKGINPKDSSMCVICEFVMSQVDNSLKNNATDEEIKHAVHSICNYLPKTVAKECNGFVDKYADAVIGLLSEFLDPKDVCAALKLCNSEFSFKENGFATERLLGGKKCTWGPSYWCQSVFHANACKATKHCQNKVWNGLKPQK